jgi:ABC-type nitrate/sulfonate/bicarbonate transport system ATPase subunit
VITLESLDFHYPNGQPIFQGFDWQVKRGQAWVVLGPSGCGKTTLLYLLAGLVKLDGGKLLIEGQTMDHPRPQTGLILQDYGLLPWATVRQNASLGLDIRAFYGPDGRHAPAYRPSRASVDTWLERLNLSELAARYPQQISGGQRQRTAIARTLVLEPDLLLMDEPFSSLDAPTRENLQDLTQSLWREQGFTLVLVTHLLEEAAVLGEAILVLGAPPHTQPQVVFNPAACKTGFRHTDDYRQMCQTLRQVMA